MSPSDSSSSLGKRLLVVGLVAVAAVAAVVVWYVNRPAPDAVSLDGALSGLTSSPTAAPTTGGAQPTTSDAGEAVSADGTWTVDTSIGTFSVTDTTGTFVGFRIAERLTSIGDTEAIGRTPEVTGTLGIDGTTLTEATFEADLTRIVSDESRRENAIQDSLGTRTNPVATFRLTSPVDLGSEPADGDTISVDAVGDLTVNGVTRSVTVPLQAALAGGTVVVTGSFDVVLVDYDVTAPSAPIVVSVADTATIEFQLYLTRS